MSDFTFKIIKSSWGIYITVKAYWCHLSEYEGSFMPVSKKLFLAIKSKNITTEQTKFLRLGLKSIVAEFDESFKDKEPVVIIIEDVLFNACDYQDEGLACVIMGWVSQEFGITTPVVDVTFDKARNQYLFGFPKTDYEMLI